MSVCLCNLISRPKSLSRVYILIRLIFGLRPPLFLLFLLQSLKPLGVEEHCEAPQQCSWPEVLILLQEQRLLYLSAATGHFHSLFAFSFFSILFLFLQNDSRLFNLTVCVFVSLKIAEKTISGPAEWKCQKACKRKSLLCRFTWSFSPLLCQCLSMFLFFCCLFVHMLVPQSLFLFCLFVPWFA